MESPVPTVKPPNSENILRRIKVLQQDTPPAETKVALEALILDPFVTSEKTARLRIRFTNTADIEREFKFGVTPPFSEFWGATEKEGSELLLLSPDNDFEKVSPDCWRPNTDSEIRMALKAQYIELGAGKEISHEFEIWDSNQNKSDECLVPGKYRFTNPYAILRNDKEDFEFTWGFSLQVEDP